MKSQRLRQHTSHHEHLVIIHVISHIGIHVSIHVTDDSIRNEVCDVYFRHKHWAWAGLRGLEPNL